MIIRISREVIEALDKSRAMKQAVFLVISLSFVYLMLQPVLQSVTIIPGQLNMILVEVKETHNAVRDMQRTGTAQVANKNY